MWNLRNAVVFFCAAIHFCCSFSVSADELPAGLEVSIQALKKTYLSNDALRVKVTYSNVSDRDIKFLVWGSALEPQMTHEFLSIEVDGQPVPYIGIHAKRLPPTAAAYRLIRAGESVSGEVDVGRSYDIKSKGLYGVSYSGLDVSAGTALRKQSLKATLNVSEDRLFRQNNRRTPIIQASCNATQRAQINEALTIAERIAQVAVRDLNNAPISLRPSARRYREWFGAYSAGRYAGVLRGMSRIASALQNNPIGFDCTCDISNRNNTFAFVFKGDPFNMNVCPVFFRVAARGTDSRSGTIIHEISHFTVVADTDDFSSALNQSGSRALARNNPSSAVRNANAFEYFAENTPFLSMPIEVLAPDLAISLGALSEESIGAGRPAFLLSQAVNMGNAQAAATTANLTLNSESSTFNAGAVPVAALAGGGRADLRFDFSAPRTTGVYAATVCVAAVAGEADRANNCFTLPTSLTVEARGIIAPILPILLDE